ncbi:hypothetical protein BH09SUM1_BH09SUM1_06140 [soil metagenome]
MSASHSPYHQIISAPAGGEDAAVTLPLSFPMQILRALLAAPVLALLFYFITRGTMEGRSTYFIAFLVGLVNPVWGFHAIALMGPLFLLRQPASHMLAGLEVFFLGICAGEIRLLGQAPIFAAGKRPVSLHTYWGLWPNYLLGLFLVLLASSLVGMQLVLFREDAPHGYPRWLTIMDWSYYGGPDTPEWTLRCLWNWGTGMLLAVFAARRMDALAAARWMKLGAVGLSVACVFALLDWAATRNEMLAFFNLQSLRIGSVDALQADRLQGTASHPAYFAEWIVLLWPGILLWWFPGRNKRNALLVAVVAVVMLALILTTTRSGWLAVIVATLGGAIYLRRTFAAAQRFLLLGAGIMVVVIVLAALIGSETLSHRFANLLGISDRANFYVSGLIMLREYPFGIGLGTHHQIYDSLFTPYFRWAEADYADAHSLWLQTLIENGPVVPLLVACGFGGLLFEVRSTWKLFDVHERTILAALVVSLIGIFTMSFSQHIVYIRVVEIAIWLIVGMIAGLCRRTRSPVDKPQNSRKGLAVLIVCGVCALLAAGMNSQRVYAGEMPRRIEFTEKDGANFWTGASWRTVADADVESISFSLYRMALVAHGEITWPDGVTERFELKPEQKTEFKHDLVAGTANWDDAPKFLQIDVSPLWTPANYDATNADDRQLGVYVGGLKFAAPSRE